MTSDRSNEELNPDQLQALYESAETTLDIEEFEKFVKVLIRVLGADQEDIRLEVSVVDLGADSMDWLDLVHEMKESLDIVIEERDTDSIFTVFTVNDWLRFVEGALTAAKIGTQPVDGGA